MKRKAVLMAIFSLMMLYSFYSKVSPKDHMKDIYLVALQSTIEQNEKLNHEMAFIAADTTSMYLATLKELRGTEWYDKETMTLDGILLRIERMEIKSNNQVDFLASKYRSGLGSFGVNLTVHYKDQVWKEKEERLLWRN